MPTAQQITPYLEEIDAARYYSNFGPLVRQLEQRLADRLAAGAYVITLSSGTLALTLALRALNCAPGAVCALPSWTFVATAHAVREAGLIPWFVDVDPQTWLLDPNYLEQALDRAPGPVGAVVPVSAFGQSVDSDAWLSFRARTGIPIMIDAAAAFDALNDASLPAIVSLHATKIVGAGEGGFFVTCDQRLADNVREQSSFGFRGNRIAQVSATNAKMSEYAAAAALAGIDVWPATRRRYILAAQRMRIALTRLPEIVFQHGWGLGWISSTCVVRLPDGTADHVERVLGAEGVDTRRWWGEGCHDNPAFRDFPCDVLSATAHLARSTIGLPFACDLDAAEISRVASALDRALHS